MRFITDVIYMIIFNSTRKCIFFNRVTNQVHHQLYERIKIDTIRKANLKAHENNISNFFLRPDVYQEVIDGIIPIPARSRWFYDGSKFSCIDNRFVSLFKSDLSSFLKLIKKLTRALTSKRVAIELSGGLDTSLIICILKYLDFDPFLIGSKSSRYESRTESFIQDYFQQRFNSVKMFSSEETLPFSNLLSTPVHQLPSSSSLYYKFAKRTAEECAKEGVHILLSGMGFDALLCENPITDEINMLPDSWQTWMLDDGWFNENIYNNYGITYKLAAASQLIIKNVWALRHSEGEDLKKWWARNFFGEFLPSELVNYAYKADNSGGFLEGFLNAKTDIAELFKVAYEVTKSDSFSLASLNKLYDNVHLVDEQKDKLVLAQVSYANWIYGLIRDAAI